jgi:hypothetical protein
MLFKVSARAISEICALDFSADIIKNHKDLESLNALVERRYFGGFAPPLCLRTEDIGQTAFARTGDYWEYEEEFHELSQGFELEPFDFEKPIENWGAEVEFRAIADLVLIVEAASDQEARERLRDGALEILYFEMNDIGDEYEVETLEIFNVEPLKTEDLV